eukprot:ANDGO_07332.mRNA.1 hypothetical protein
MREERSAAMPKCAVMKCMQRRYIEVIHMLCTEISLGTRILRSVPDVSDRLASAFVECVVVVSGLLKCNEGPIETIRASSFRLLQSFCRLRCGQKTAPDGLASLGCLPHHEALIEGACWLYLARAARHLVIMAVLNSACFTLASHATQQTSRRYACLLGVLAPNEADLRGTLWDSFLVSDANPFFWIHRFLADNHDHADSYEHLISPTLVSEHLAMCEWLLRNMELPVADFCDLVTDFHGCEYDLLASLNVGPSSKLEFQMKNMRRALGQYMTPRSVAVMMVNISTRNASCAVRRLNPTPPFRYCVRSFLDPAMGSGVFIGAYIHAIVQFIHHDVQSMGRFPTIDVDWCHVVDQLCEEIYGVDRDRCAHELACMNCMFMMLPLVVRARAQRFSFILKSMKLHCFDSLQILRSRRPFAVPENDDVAHWSGKLFDFILANPPYVAQSSSLCCSETSVFPDATVAMRFRDVGVSTNGRADLYYLFIVLGLFRLSAYGVYCFVTPSAWLTNIHAQFVRQLLHRYARIRDMIYLQNSIFRDADVDSLVTVITHPVLGNSRTSLWQFSPRMVMAGDLHANFDEVLDSVACQVLQFDPEVDDGSSYACDHPRMIHSSVAACAQHRYSTDWIISHCRLCMPDEQIDVLSGDFCISGSSAHPYDSFALVHPCAMGTQAFSSINSALNVVLGLYSFPAAVAYSEDGGSDPRESPQRDVILKLAEFSRRSKTSVPVLLLSHLCAQPLLFFSSWKSFSDYAGSLVVLVTERSPEDANGLCVRIALPLCDAAEVSCCANDFRHVLPVAQDLVHWHGLLDMLPSRTGVYDVYSSLSDCVGEKSLFEISRGPQMTPDSVYHHSCKDIEKMSANLSSVLVALSKASDMGRWIYGELPSRLCVWAHPVFAPVDPHSEAAAWLKQRFSELPADLQMKLRNTFGESTDMLYSAWMTKSLVRFRRHLPKILIAEIQRREFHYRRNRFFLDFSGGIPCKKTLAWTPRDGRVSTEQVRIEWYPHLSTYAEPHIYFVLGLMVSSVRSFFDEHCGGTRRSNDGLRNYTTVGVVEFPIKAAASPMQRSVMVQLVARCMEMQRTLIEIDPKMKPPGFGVTEVHPSSLLSLDVVQAHARFFQVFHSFLVVFCAIDRYAFLLYGFSNAQQREMMFLLGHQFAVDVPHDYPGIPSAFEFSHSAIMNHRTEDIVSFAQFAECILPLVDAYIHPFHSPVDASQ